MYVHLEVYRVMTDKNKWQITVAYLVFQKGRLLLTEFICCIWLYRAAESLSPMHSTAGEESGCIRPVHVVCVVYYEFFEGPTFLTKRSADMNTNQPPLTHIICTTRVKVYGHIAHADPSMDPVSNIILHLQVLHSKHSGSWSVKLYCTQVNITLWQIERMHAALCARAWDGVKNSSGICWYRKTDVQLKSHGVSFIISVGWSASSRER